MPPALSGGAKQPTTRDVLLPMAGGWRLVAPRARQRQHLAGRARPNARRRGPRAAGSMSRRRLAHGEKLSPTWCPTPRASRPRILGRRPPPGRGNAPAAQPHARTRRRRRTTTNSQEAGTDQAGTQQRLPPPHKTSRRIRNPAGGERATGMGDLHLAGASAEGAGLAPGLRGGFGAI
jgi:hypothetical protein